MSSKINAADFLRATLGEDTYEGLMGFSNGYNRHKTIYDKVADLRTTNKLKVEALMNKGLGYAGSTSEDSNISAPNRMHQLWTNSAYMQHYEVNYRLTWLAVKALSRNQAILKILKGNGEKSLAMDMKKDRAFCEMLNSYDSGTYGDGVVLGSTSQKTGDGSTYANIATAAASITTAAIEAADIAVMQYVDTGGKYIKPELKQIIAHVSQKYNIARVQESEYEPGGQLNDKNVVRSNKVIPEQPALSPHIANDGSWFLKTDVPEGLIMYTMTGGREFAMMPLDMSRDVLSCCFESFVPTVNEKRSLYIYPRA